MRWIGNLLIALMTSLVCGTTGVAGPGVTTAPQGPFIRHDCVFRWDAVTATDLKEYRLYVSQQSGAYDRTAFLPIERPSPTALPPTETTCVAAGITTDQTFYAVLTAVDFSGNESADSNEVRATRDTLAPDAVQLGIAPLANGSGCTLRWTAAQATDVEEYRVYVSQTTGQYDRATFSRRGTQLTATCADVGITPDQTFYATVAAVDYAGHEAELSNEVTSPRDTTPPDKVILRIDITERPDGSLGIGIRRAP